MSIQWNWKTKYKGHPKRELSRSGYIRKEVLEKELEKVKMKPKKPRC